MTIDEAKALLPTELIYPLPDCVIDNLINVQTIPIKFTDDDDDDVNDKGLNYALLAALIELKERRGRDGK